MFKRLFGRNGPIETPPEAEARDAEQDWAPPPRDPGPWDSPSHRFGWRQWVGYALGSGLQEEAHAFARLDLKEARRLVPPDRQDQLLDLMNLVGHLSIGQGDTVSAERLAQEALGIAQRSSHATEVDVATIFVRLGDISRRRGDQQSALAHFSEALEVRKRALGPDHRHTADLQRYVDNFDARRTDPRTDWEIEQAQDIEALRREASGSAVHGDHAAAEATLREAANLAIPMLGGSHPDVAEIFRRLAEALDARGHHRDARKYHFHALDIVGESLGGDCVDALLALERIARNRRHIECGDDRGPSELRTIEAVRTPEHLHVWVLEMTAAS